MTRPAWTALAVVLALAGGVTPLAAQTRSESPAASPSAAAPEKIEGTVTEIDQKSGTVTLRGEDGKTFQFRGDADTLRDLKVGQKIELTRRMERK
jgi:Cu/Ag efflux protein CusF